MLLLLYYTIYFWKQIDKNYIHFLKKFTGSWKIYLQFFRNIQEFRLDIKKFSGFSFRTIWKFLFWDYSNILFAHFRISSNLIHHSIEWSWQEYSRFLLILFNFHISNHGFIPKKCKKYSIKFIWMFRDEFNFAQFFSK